VFGLTDRRAGGRCRRHRARFIRLEPKDRIAQYFWAVRADPAKWSLLHSARMLIGRDHLARDREQKAGMGWW